MFRWQFFITYIFSVSLKFEACYFTGQSSKFWVKTHTLFLCTFLTFCCCFLSKKLCFYHFHCFFFEVSNFRSRILTNQESELVIRNCQWHCMLSGTILILFLIFWWLRRAQGISTHCKALQLGCQVSSDLTCCFRALEFLEEFSDFEDFI